MSHKTTLFGAILRIRAIFWRIDPLLSAFAPWNYGTAANNGGLMMKVRNVTLCTLGLALLLMAGRGLRSDGSAASQTDTPSVSNLSTRVAFLETRVADEWEMIVLHSKPKPTPTGAANVLNGVYHISCSRGGYVGIGQVQIETVHMKGGGGLPAYDEITGAHVTNIDADCTIKP